MKTIILFSVLLTQSLYANQLTCLLQSEGPDKAKSIEFDFDLSKENYIYKEYEVNEYIYSSMSAEFDREKGTVDIYMALTDEDDYAAEEQFSLDLGETEYSRGYYILEDKEYDYEFLCSFEK